MNEIIRIDSNVPHDVLRIELFLSNVCNYKCWYCFPGSNEGTHKWPDLEPLTENLSFLLNYYKNNKNKTKFLLHIIGGEPTVWPNIESFIQYFKENFSVLVSISTNGSRTLRWWNDNAHLFDHVMISCHHQYIKSDHVISVADLLYKKNVNLTAMVLMDSREWNKCLGIIEQLKRSKYRWPITVLEVFHETITYTADQKNFISKSLKRMPNLFYWFRSKKIPNVKPTITYNNFKKTNVSNNWLSLNNLNKFKDWKCNIGIDTLYIDKVGNLQGACGENLYDLNYKHNILDKNFVEKFNPTILPTTCHKEFCYCQPEINTTKFIPIKPV
jgi:organic radical activating enzyme